MQLIPPEVGRVCVRPGHRLVGEGVQVRRPRAVLARGLEAAREPSLTNAKLLVRGGSGTRKGSLVTG